MQLPMKRQKTTKVYTTKWKAERLRKIIAWQLTVQDYTVVPQVRQTKQVYTTTKNGKDQCHLRQGDVNIYWNVYKPVSRASAIKRLKTIGTRDRLYRL